MKIYFAGSIRGGTEDQDIYCSLIEKLQTFGQVLTEHVGNPMLTAQGEKDMRDSEIFKWDVAWVREADVIVAEVTTPSLGVGYEIGLAESLGKPICCLYRKIEGRQLSAMIAGNLRVQVKVYERVDEAVSHVTNFLEHRVR